LPAALVTALKGTQVSPLFNLPPRFALVPFLKFAIKNENKNDAEGDLHVEALIPTIHFDVQLVIETEGMLESIKAVLAEVLPCPPSHQGDARSPG
jgi:hypothetical protein